MYRFLTSADPTWRMVWPGAIFTGVLYTAIQLAGAQITKQLSESEAYGDIGLVLALLSWLSLHAIINLFGGEINAALHRLRTGPDHPDHPDRLDSPAVAEAPLAGS